MKESEYNSKSQVGKAINSRYNSVVSKFYIHQQENHAIKNVHELIGIYRNNAAEKLPNYNRHHTHFKGG